MGETAGEMRRRGQDGGAGQNRETVSAAPQGADEGTAEIRAAIEETRAELSETVDAIQAQLSPEHLKDQAKERAREATVGRAQQVTSRVRETATRARETAAGRAQQLTRRTPETAKRAGSSIIERIKQHPVPVALTTLVLGGLMILLRMRKMQGARASSS